MKRKDIAKNLNKEYEDLELIKLPELVQNVYYKIISVHKTINKFGRPTVIATIKRCGKLCKTFLPERYYKYDNIEGLEFKYCGREKYKDYEYNKIEFKEDYDD